MTKKSLPALAFALLLISAPLFFSCRIRTPDTVQTESETDREHRIEVFLQDYERRIRELDAKAQATAGTLREELRRSLDDAWKKHQEAEKKLEELRASTNRAWKDVNAELQILLDEMKKAVDQAREQLK